MQSFRYKPLQQQVLIWRALVRLPAPATKWIHQNLTIPPPGEGDSAQGSTLHGQEMGSTCSLILKNLELEFNKPVGMGIIGPGATAEQAATRVAYAGARAHQRLFSASGNRVGAKCRAAWKLEPDC